MDRSLVPNRQDLAPYARSLMGGSQSIVRTLAMLKYASHRTVHIMTIQ